MSAAKIGDRVRVDGVPGLEDGIYKLASISPHVLRPSVEDDRNLIIQSWMRSHRRNCYRDHIDDVTYARGQEWLIKQLLERCATLVACLDTDPSYIMGWAVTSTGAVHYCWVRHAHRRQGIARDLLRPYLGKPTLYTHPISVGADWMGTKWDKVPKGWVFDPFHAYRLAAYPRATHA